MPPRSVTLKERALGIRKALKGLDQFGFVPVPRPAKGAQISLRGMIGTLALWSIFIAFLISSILILLQDTPAMSLYSAPAEGDPIDMPALGLTYRRNVAGRPLDFFYNDSFFRVWFEQVTGTNQDREVRTTKVLGAVPCDLSPWSGWSGSQAMCPGSTPQIGGSYVTPSWTLLAIHVMICDPASPFYSSSGKIVPCAPRSEINAVLANGRFNLIINYETFDNGFQYESDWYLYNADARMLFEGVFAKQKTTATANYIWAWSTVNFVTLRKTFEKTLVIPQSLAPQYGGGRVVLSIYARGDPYDQFELRRRVTILDFLGNCAAVYSALFTILALYFASYNEAKFYDEQPDWSGMGASPFVKAAETGTQCDAECQS